MYIMQDSTLQQLKAQINENLHLYESNTVWCKELLDMGEVDTSLPVDLKFGEGKKSDYDLEHAILLHRAYNNLPLVIARKESFWAFLTHTIFWNYMRERWPIEDAQKSETNFIMTRYFYGSGSFARNGLARLWWYAQFTYDATLEDPYFYTRLALRTQDLAGLIAQSANINRNKKVLQASLLVVNKLIDLEEANEIPKIKEREKFIRSIFIHANHIAVVTVLEFLDLEDLQHKLWEFVVEKLNVSRDLYKRELIVNK